MWDHRNPGKREGWHKQEDSYCLDCTSPKTVEKILVIAATAPAPAFSPQLRLVKKRATA